MALLFVDGFDHYQTSDLKFKWDNMDGIDPTATHVYINNTIPRTGGHQYLQLSNKANDGSVSTSGGTIRKMIPSKPETIIIGFAFNIAEFNGALGQVALYNESGDDIIKYRFYKNPNFDKFGVQVYDANDNLLGQTADNLIDDMVWYYLETKTYVNNSSGSVQIRLNGATHLQLENINTDPSNGLYNGVSHIDITGALYYSTSVTLLIDDLYILDNSGLQNNDFLGDVYIQAIFPESNGTHSDWTPSAGSNYECVDDIDIDEDATFVSTTTDNAIDTYNFGAVTAITGSTIKAVVSNITAKKDGASIRHIAPIVRENNLEYEGGDVNLSDTYKNYQYVWENNPEDNQPWEISDIDNAEFGVKLTPNT